MENKGINTSVECTECKKIIKLDRSIISYNDKFKTKDGKIILLTSYKCPNCNKVHYCQIDDDRTLSLKRDITSMMIKMSKMYINGDDLSKNQSDKFKKYRERLNKMRILLMKKYSGQTVETEHGESINLTFTLPVNI